MGSGNQAVARQPLSDRDRWNDKYRAGHHDSASPSPWLVSLADRLPRSGRALDVAGGAGRNALWLAERGLDVTLADVSDVALEIAQARADERQLRIRTERVDLACEALPAPPWDLIVDTLYLERALFSAFAGALAPEGMLVFLQPTERNLERHARPPRRFLLKEGELATLVPPRLEIVVLEENWSDNGYHEARLLARNNAPPRALPG